MKPAFAQGPVNIGSNFAFGYIPSFGVALNSLVPLAFAIAAVLLVFYFILAAFEMIYSQGDKNEVASARAKITHAIIGFVILIFVFLLLQFLPQALLGENTSFKIIK